MIVMFCLTLIAGYYYLLSDEFEQLGKHLAASCIFIQNITFFKESGYFDSAAELKPLLHLWSLAVEEQFYIFFPPFLIILWRNKMPISFTLAVLILVSLVANLFMSLNDSAADFFLTPYRSWELLAGSLLAWWHFSKSQKIRLGNLYSLFGIILIIFSFIWLDKGNPYPGWRAIFPVVGAALLIAAGPTPIINKWLLSNPLAIWIGLISYPLYLFHWPLLSFLRILKGGHPNSVSILLAVAMSFALAALTYYFFEKKIRYAKSRWTIPLLVTAFIISGILGVLIWQKTLKPRSSALGFDEHIQASLDMKYFKGVDATLFHPEIWIQEGKNTGFNTLYIGDSHMQQFAPRIFNLFTNEKTGDRGFIFFTLGGLLPVPGVSVSFGAQPQPYDVFIPKMLELAERKDVDRVVIAARWILYFSWKSKELEINSFRLETDEGFKLVMESLQNMIETFVANGKQVFVILSMATDTSFDPKLMIDRKLNGDISLTPRVYTVEEFRDLKKPKTMKMTQGELMDEITHRAELAGAKIIDPMPYLSKDGVCFRLIDGKPIYRDGTHLRASFVREHANYLDETILP
jgi:peptidoglycan/LPS O-acetylase OafA/YrhL